MDRRPLSYTSTTSDEPLLGITIGDMLDAIAARFPQNDALVVRHQDVRYTYDELRRSVDRVARGLLALGVEKGDRVGIWAPNTAEWALTQYAASKLGAILVNINPNYRTHELAYVLNQSGCRSLVTARRFRDQDYLAMLYEVAPELSACAPGALRADRLPSLRSVVVMGTAHLPGAFTWNELLEAADRVDPASLAARQAELEFDDPINIQYTSGTTGFPKGATLSHHNILNNGYFTARTMGFTDRDRLVIPVPLYHCFGMVLGNLACLTTGATAIFPSEGFDPRATLEAVEAEKATALHGVPTMFIAELEHPEFASFDLRSLRTGLMAGAPCPVEVMRRVVTSMHMRDVEIAYGMTETSPVSFQTRLDAPIERRVSTIGQVHPHVEVKVVDPGTGRVVPRGTPGELCTRGYSVMLGYWGNDEATRACIDAARWMHTGDLAAMDDEGYVKIVGRTKDMIIRGGENVSPRELEEFLYTHPKVVDVQVIGVPDPKLGEEVMAWVRLREGETATADELRDYCRGKIAKFKIPRYFKFVDGFPMTVTGKVQKYRMREQSIEELGLAVAAGIKTS